MTVYKEFSSIRTIGYKEPVIKKISDIIKNKHFEDESLFVIEGLWAHEKIIKSNIVIRNFLFCPDYIKSEVMLDLVRFNIKSAEESYLISNNICNKLTSREGGGGFFLLCSLPKYNFNDIELKEDNLIVILDGLENPGNMGTIIRSMDGAGGDGVIICNSNVKKANQKLIKASMGSSFVLPVIKSDSTRTARWLKSNGFKIIVTDLKANKSYYNIDYKGRIAIIAGNEIHGISDIWGQQSCEHVIIPMFGVADSLNVGVAASMVIYEASYQQHVTCQTNSRRLKM